MGEEDTYLRAKLTEINSSINGLTEMLNRMIDVLSKISEVQDATSETKALATANSQKLDALMEKVEGITVAASPAVRQAVIAEKGAVPSMQIILDTLESQVREGVIASDLSMKISDTAKTLERKMGKSGPLIVKMQRWKRILKTYGRVDTISPQDLQKLRLDIKDWGKELAKMR